MPVNCKSAEREFFGFELNGLYIRVGLYIGILQPGQ